MSITRRDVIEVVEGLLEYFEPIKTEDLPESCGKCGTEGAECTTACVERANGLMYQQRTEKAKELVELIRTLPKQKGRTLSEDGMDRLCMATTACPECEEEFDEAPPKRCVSRLHKEIFDYINKPSPSNRPDGVDVGMEEYQQ